MKRQGTYTYDANNGVLTMTYDDGDYAVYTLKAVSQDRLTFSREMDSGILENFILQGESAAAFSLPDPYAWVNEAASRMEEGNIISILLLMADSPVFLDRNGKKVSHGKAALDNFKQTLGNIQGKDMTTRILNTQALECRVNISDWEIWTFTLYAELIDGRYKVVLLELFTDMLG